MIDTIKAFLAAIPSLAGNPIGLIGFVVAVLGWGFVYYRYNKLASIREELKRMPEGDIRRYLAARHNVILPNSITPADWLANNRQRMLLAAFGILLLFSFLIFLVYKALPDPQPAKQIVNASFAQMGLRNGYDISNLSVESYILIWDAAETTYGPLRTLEDDRYVEPDPGTNNDPQNVASISGYNSIFEWSKNFIRNEG
ncbi:MAG: hypothetical protein ACRC67_22685 [Inquilinus sp.]|uniref:hypothetical protein n=1 Tax=Inquilinus sp. TaxID=1932117 RepID=UPI003F3B80F6